MVSENAVLEWLRKQNYLIVALDIQLDLLPRECADPVYLIRWIDRVQERRNAYLMSILTAGSLVEASFVEVVSCCGSSL